MKDVWVLVLGLLVFLIPAALLAWSVLTTRGRKAYERNIEEAEKWPRLGGVIPLRPPQSALTRWAYSHPWTAAAVVGVAELAIVYFASRVAIERGHAGAIADALWVGVEGFVILGLIFRGFSKHYGEQRAGQ